MAKIKLGSAPKTFARKVEFDLVDGSKADINVAYRYRTRAQFAEFMAGVYAPPEALAEPVAFDFVQVGNDSINRDVKFILGAVESWDLEDELNAVNVRRLVDEFPSASNAIAEHYRAAISEGRSKN